jgi:hypothetical protein
MAIKTVVVFYKYFRAHADNWARTGVYHTTFNTETSSASEVLNKWQGEAVCKYREYEITNVVIG